VYKSSNKTTIVNVIYVNMPFWRCCNRRHERSKI